MRKKSLLAMVLCMVMLLSSVAVYAADAAAPLAGPGDERTIGSGSVGLVREKALRGKMTLTASSFGVELEYIKATVTVERKVSGSWIEYQEPFEVYGDAEMGNLAVGRYINVDDTGTYRIKAIFEDKIGSVTTKTDAKYSQACSL